MPIKKSGLDGMAYDVFKLDTETIEGIGGSTPPATSAVTAVAASTSVVTLLALNAARRGGVIFNKADRDLYVKFGASASATSFTFIIPPDGYEPLIPYTGAITGIWDTGVNTAMSAHLTELSA
jgi:hypothetical protein